MRAATFGVKPPQQFTGIESLRKVWAIVDDSGLDGCWVFDHFAPMGRIRTGDIFEAWTILAAMAQATRRVRVGTLVTGNVYRHPAVLAKMAVTVDHLSGGRLDLGFGAGGDAYADTMLGLPPGPAAERIERLDEACQVLKLLWTQSGTTFEGRHYRLTDATSEPRPVQPGGPPLWLGSSGERRGLRVVAQRADGWINAQFLRTVAADPSGEDLVELRRLGEVLDAHCARIGRDPGTIRRAVQFPLPDDADDALRTAERYVRAGFGDVIFMIVQAGDGAVQAAEAAAALLPRLRELG
jgi:alkanesulfonate monooxygenase SsuD/methylene tetrahydromethanopterin reductase-like flavin-dependent oxidoreductase (luciferase family)